MTVLHKAILLCVLGLVGGCGLGKRTVAPAPAAIEQAEARSGRGANPQWLKLTDRAALFRHVRNRAYAYCYRRGAIDMKCAGEQDDAVEGAVMAIVVADAQREMADKDKLGRKENWVATNPEIAPRVLNYCWSLYREHGAADARILSVCLGNLTDYSPLIPLPVP